MPQRERPRLNSCGYFNASAPCSPFNVERECHLGGCSQNVFWDEQENAGGEAESGLAWSQLLTSIVSPATHREQLWNK